MSGLQTGSGTVKSLLSVRKDDLYETPPVAVHALLQRVNVPSVVWEPACGPGVIVRELRKTGRKVFASDLVDYGCDDSTSRRDFLMEQAAPAPCIITNPPFKLAEEFCSHAKELAPDVFMLLRLAFLEGMRWDRGLAQGLERVLIFAPRLPFMHRSDYEGPKNSNSGMPFAWFIWRRGTTKSPEIEWINWRAQ